MNPYGETLRHEDVNPFCGDRVRIEIAVAPDNSVRAARFQGDLCMIAKAASSLLTEMITGSAGIRYEERRPTTTSTALSIFLRPIVLCSVGKSTNRPLVGSRMTRADGDVF